jgi:hypothetical protein
LKPSKIIEFGYNIKMNKTEILHQAACKRKQNGYSDPETGFFVLTEYYLAQRGHCCGAGCRHCPYDADEQRRAGRETITGDENIIDPNGNLNLTPKTIQDKMITIQDSSPKRRN